MDKDKQKTKSVIKRETPEGKIREESEILAAYEQLGDMSGRQKYVYGGDYYDFYGRNEY